MKIKTADLIGPALDWAVAQCEGKVYGYKHQLVDDCRDVIPYTPSTDWAIGGPLIEKAWIKVGVIDDDTPVIWAAQLSDPWRKRKSVHSVTGPTPLVAAMRCFCCAKLGDEIEIPQELQLCQQPNL